MPLSQVREVQLVLTNLLIQLNDWILVTFNKEALAIFAVLCVAFFAVAAMFAYFGFQSGEFTNQEDAKLEMLDC